MAIEKASEHEQHPPHPAQTYPLTAARLEQSATRSSTASAFLKALLYAAPYRVHTVLTDNGTQLCDRQLLSFEFPAACPEETINAFGVGFSTSEKADLAAFLRTLSWIRCGHRPIATLSSLQ